MAKSVLSKEWREILPDEIQASLIRALEQSEANQTIPHEEAMKPYLKWLEKSKTTRPSK